MRGLVLEALQSLHRHRETIAGYVRVAREHGDLRLCILTREGVRETLPYSDLPPEIELLEEVPDYFIPGALERRAMSLLTERPCDAIFAPREDDIIRAARLRELFDIPGQSVESARAYRDKWQMKSRVARAGVPVWPSTRVNDAVDFWAALERFGVPCVLKPRSDRLTRHVEFIRDPADALAAYQRSIQRVPLDAPLRYVLEPYADRRLCHSDGVWHDGRLYCNIASEYIGATSARPSMGAPFGSVTLDPASERAGRIRRSVEDVIRALPSSHTFLFHAELWEDETGELCLNEIASRPGGRFIASNTLNATGAEPDSLWLALVCGLDPRRIGYVGESEFRPSASVALPYRSGRVRALPERCELDFVVSYKPAESITVGTVLPPQRVWWDTLGDVTLIPPSHADLPTAVDRLLDWARAEIVIEDEVPA
ncbi:MAG: acetyl-CoA carboxylase biotin carboxylase subunit family protein [Frankiaceae bacterium]